MLRGELIKKIRKEKKLTQEQLAKKCGLSTITIRQYETGKRYPSIETLIPIADALEVSFDSLLDDQSKEAGMYKAIIAAHNSLTKYSKGELVETSIEDVAASERKEHINQAFSLLNDEGQRVAVERIDELTEIAKYRRSE